MYDQAKLPNPRGANLDPTSTPTVEPLRALTVPLRLVLSAMHRPLAMIATANREPRSIDLGRNALACDEMTRHLRLVKRIWLWVVSVRDKGPIDLNQTGPGARSRDSAKRRIAMVLPPKTKAVF